jgi:hypothetical protein
VTASRDPDVADRELAEILRDEPGWAGRFEIVTVDFSGRSRTPLPPERDRRAGPRAVAVREPLESSLTPGGVPAESRLGFGQAE